MDPSEGTVGYVLGKREEGLGICLEGVLENSYGHFKKIFRNRPKKFRTEFKNWRTFQGTL